jgi:hypothetical protein
MAKGIPGVGPKDTKALVGLRRLTKMVLKSARGGETARHLALRIRRGLHEIDIKSRNNFLEDFEDLYQMAKSDKKLLEKVQDLARDFAARGPSRKSRRNRTKGAAYAIQEAAHGLRVTKLIGIEPASFTDNRLYRDLVEKIKDKLWYVELKAWDDLSSKVRSVKLARQMYKHFRRLEKNTPLMLMLPVMIRSTGSIPSLKAKNRVIGSVVAALMTHHKVSREKALSWALENLNFEQVPLKYQMR